MDGRDTACAAYRAARVAHGAGAELPDPAGAGDSLLVCTAMAMALGRSVWESLYLGSLAAACQVGRIGNIPLKTSELLVELNKSNHI